MKMRLILTCLFLLPVLNLAAGEGKSFEIPRSQVIPIQDSQSGGKYELYIKLPEGYAENNQIKYPVIYFTDAAWHMEILSVSQNFIMEESILVGISWRKDISKDLPEHVSRFSDYTFEEHRDPEVQEKYQLGKAQSHLRFIREDVISYVERNYRTEPENKTYFGYSLGGSFGAYILLKQPATFNNYILGSPALNGDLPFLTELAAKQKQLNANVFISYGKLEKDLAEHADAFIELLKGRNDKHLSLDHESIEGNHKTAFPTTGVRSITWLANHISAVSALDPDLAFRDVPVMKKPIFYAKPYFRNDTISVGAIGVDSGDKETVLTFAQEIADEQHGRVDSLLIAHKDKLLFESYFLRGRLNAPHPQASTTKSHTSMAIGRAIQLGHLKMEDLHKPIASFFDKVDPTKFAAGAETVTLHKAMSMQSGIRISSDTMEALEADPNALKGQKEVQAYLENSAPITPETQSFLYQGPDPALVMQVLNAVVPGGAERFIKNELFNKMGIEDYRWRIEPTGLPAGGSGSSITSRDMLKLGLLVKNQGKWQGEQFVPAAYVAQATSKVGHPTGDITIPEGMTSTAYGYFYWVNEVTVGGQSYLIKSGQGGGGQYIVIVDALDLVIVVTAHQRDYDFQTVLAQLAKRIIPAFTD